MTSSNKTVRRDRRYQHKSAGYVLVESMIALLIAALGCAGLTQAISQSSRLGISARQSTELSIADSSFFTNLRLHQAAHDRQSAHYRFRQSDRETVQPTEPLAASLQQIIDNLSVSLIDIDSRVSCNNNAITTCEVCFHWYDPGKQSASAQAYPLTEGATNRSRCRTEIV